MKTHTHLLIIVSACIYTCMCSYKNIAWKPAWPGWESENEKQPGYRT